MSINTSNARHLLRSFNFKTLFIEELGWDNHESSHYLQLEDGPFILNSIAEKRGVQIFECITPTKEYLPRYLQRKKIDREITKLAYEHLIIFYDNEKTTQIWQWVNRRPKKADAYREYRFDKDHSFESLIQKLDTISFNLHEEETLSLSLVTAQLKDAMDRDKITTRFYDRFKKEKDIFIRFIEGITADSDRDWYGSVMLNRLMFVYFIQKRGFLDDDRDYLRNHLRFTQKRLGKDKFQTFYRHFLLRLFHEGLNKQPPRGNELDNLLGKIPYLNGGLFQIHQIERLYNNIDVSDEAFERIFDFFDQYEWHLDDRPLSKGNEINPDVLGHIFEKYINQKELGAYYSKEDITEYISTSTIIPYIVESARENCKIAFEGEHSVWKLLQENPDRYIHDAMKKGSSKKLPDKIEKGIVDVSLRGDWNKVTDSEYALPTEIWRETVARYQNCQNIKKRLDDGKIYSIHDFITNNLDLRQFVQDVIENCEGPELLRSIYYAIRTISILDPTVGSGAFLFAALNVLEPLYEACLDRMQMFLDELPEGESSEKFSDFRQILEDLHKEHSRKYTIYKSITINNLYGVDIIDEAVEICKLRLFLKLIAQVEDVDHIEPLPDIDFNIRTGNTLVGFCNYDELKSYSNRILDFDNQMKKIDEEAKEVDRLSDKFRKMQSSMIGVMESEIKEEIQYRLEKLEEEINTYLAVEYGVDHRNEEDYKVWLESYKPFHWFVEFYSIIKSGGFDVIIGNPPYLEIQQVDYYPRNLSTLESRAIHAMCIERSCMLLKEHGCMSLIVPLAIVSTQRMKPVQDILETNRDVWYSNYSWRPGKLFDKVNRALTIFIAIPTNDQKTYSTNYQKWNSDCRDMLMQMIKYVEIPNDRPSFWVPKYGDEIETSILNKCFISKSVLGNFISNTLHRIYYRTTGGLYWKVFTDFPPKFFINGKKGHSSRETWFSVNDKRLVKPVVAILSSNLFWWWYTTTTNCRDLNPIDYHSFPIFETILNDIELSDLGRIYIEDLNKNSVMLLRNQRQTGNTETQSFIIHKSKPIIDKIDSILAKHYGFTDKELDFIMNYDIKYRMGLENLT